MPFPLPAADVLALRDGVEGARGELAAAGSEPTPELVDDVLDMLDEVYAAELEHWELHPPQALDDFVRSKEVEIAAQMVSFIDCRAESVADVAELLPALDSALAAALDYLAQLL